MPIFKEALDLSFLDNYTEAGEGAYGIYYSAFPKEKLEEIKRNFGMIDPNIGIKVLRTPQLEIEIIENIAEVLALYFIAPELNKIGIKTIHTNMPLSFSNLIHNRAIVTKNIPGNKFLDMDYTTLIGLEYTVCTLLRDKMEQAGIYWNDCHGDNYKLNDTIISEFNEIYKNVREKNPDYTDRELSNAFFNSPFFDENKIINNLTIIDFGRFKCKPGSEAANNIDRWYHSLNKENIKNSYLVKIEKAISAMMQ